MLHPEDAYSLAVHLFKDLYIPQSRAPYPNLLDLLELPELLELLELLDLFQLA